MKNKISIVLILILIVTSVAASILFSQKAQTKINDQQIAEQLPSPQDYWFLLYRKSKEEFLYRGTPGDTSKSELIKKFVVNVGINNERPTPLPKLVGKEYWNLVGEVNTETDPETSPYFLTLDIPWSEEYPYGPIPYTECNGSQCDWVRPGAFGLHGIASDSAKLTDSGSSGCIRHNDEDITYLYNLLDPSEQNPIRYYIEDV